MTPDRIREAAWYFVVRDDARLAMQRNVRTTGVGLHPASEELLALLTDLASQHTSFMKAAPSVYEPAGKMGDDVLSTTDIAEELECSVQRAAWLLRAGPPKGCSWRSTEGRGRPRLVRRSDFEKWRQAC